MSREGEDCRVKVWGQYSGGEGNYAIVTGGYRMWLVGVGRNHNEEHLGHALCKGVGTGEMVSNWVLRVGDADEEGVGKLLPLLLLAGLDGFVGGVVGTGGESGFYLSRKKDPPGPGSRTDNAHALPHGQDGPPVYYFHWYRGL